RQGTPGSRHRSLPVAAAPDFDDVVRVHSRGAAAGDLNGLGIGDAPGGGRRRVLRHARGDAVRPDLYADLLHAGPQSGRSLLAPKARAGRLTSGQRPPGRPVASPRDYWIT